jgi:D-alanyl-D-alanine dipeptidase
MTLSNRLPFKPLVLILLLWAPLAFAQKLETIRNGEFVNVAMVYSLKDGKRGQALNLCHMRLYNGNAQVALLSPEATALLRKAANSLQVLFQGDLELMVYDAYRQRSVQNMLETRTGFDSLARATEAHTRGNAVDITLVRAVNGTNEPQDMGSPANDMGLCSFAEYEESCFKEGKLTSNQRNNRKILRRIMIEQAGWCQPKNTGWWHFELCRQ